MMTETHINSNHMLNSGLSTKSDIDKMDDVGWKAKLKIPPKDKRIKTSVSYKCIEKGLIVIKLLIDKIFSYIIKFILTFYNMKVLIELNTVWEKF